MIDTELWNRIADQAVKVNEGLQKAVIDLLVSRLLANGEKLTASNIRLVEKLQETGMLREEIEKEIAKRSKKSREEVKKIFEDAQVRELRFSQQFYQEAGMELSLSLTKPMQALIQEAIDQTNAELRNITGTMAQSTENTFQNTLDQAFYKVRSGAFSYEQAIADAIEEAAKEGSYIHYPSGARRRVETATRSAILAGVNQSSIRQAVQLCRDLGWNHISVSSHLGARTYQKGKPAYADHSAWQGKVYWLDRPEAGYRSFKEVCGWGHGDGIGGWGCRHSAFAWTEGMGNPFQQYDSEENKKRYELEQKQRQKERRIRDTKILLDTLDKAMKQTNDEKVKFELQQKYDKAAFKLRQYNREYREFCEENNLKPYHERLKTVEWDREQSHKALLAANRFKAVAGDGRTGEERDTGGGFREEEEKTKRYGDREEDTRYTIDDSIKEHREDTPERMLDLLEKYTKDEFVRLDDTAEHAFAYDPDLDEVVINRNHPQYLIHNYREVMVHEIAHRIDQNEFGSPMNLEFSNAIIETREQVMRNSDKYRKMFESGGELEYNSLISDILGCITDNSIVGGSFHESQYIGIPGYSELEIFADIFSALYQGDDITVKFIKEELSSIYQAFFKIMRGE